MTTSPPTDGISRAALANLLLNFPHECCGSTGDRRADDCPVCMAVQWLEQSPPADAGKVEANEIDGASKSTSGAVTEALKFSQPEARQASVNSRAAPDAGKMEPCADQAPIARVTVTEGDFSSVTLYAPGLPPGDHDLYCVPHPGFAPEPDKKPVIPDVLFDGYGVLSAMTPDERKWAGPEAVGSVLDAVVRLLRGPALDASGREVLPPVINQRCPKCGFVTADVFNCPTCKNPEAPYSSETKRTSLP